MILDYGIGNLFSVQKALKLLSIDAIISRDKEAIMNSKGVILAGVGNFKQAINNIKDNYLNDTLNELVSEKRNKLIGICLGMQLLCNWSEEGNAEGLCYLNALVKKFDKNRFQTSKLKIPHMGWNNVSVNNEYITEYREFDIKDYFYFVHSYHVDGIDNKYILFSTKYGYDFTSAVLKDNIIGLQFHPEKSFKPGLKLLSKILR